MSNREKKITWGIIIVNLAIMIGLMVVQYGLVKKSNDIIYCLEHNTCPHIFHKMGDK